MTLHFLGAKRVISFVELAALEVGVKRIIIVCCVKPLAGSGGIYRFKSVLSLLHGIKQLLSGL